MMTPLPVQSFPAMKGVVTFSLDEDELNGAGDPNFMHLCAIRKRTVHVLRITNEGVSTIRVILRFLLFGVSTD